MAMTTSLSHILCGLNLLERSELSELEYIEIEVKLLEIGNTRILFIPGEMFVEIGKNIKLHNEYEHNKYLHICCYANGYIGYVPTKNAFRDHDYESWAAIVGQDTESIIIEAAKKLFGLCN